MSARERALVKMACDLVDKEAGRLMKTVCLGCGLCRTPCILHPRANTRILRPAPAASRCCGRI